MNEAHTFQRIIAYIVDIFIISIICFALTAGIPESKKYKDAQKESDALIDNYMDKKINESEYIDKLYETKYIMGKETIANSLIAIVISFAYFAGFAYYNKGQTFGKKLLHIKVVSKDGKEANYLQMMYRAMIHNGCLFSIISVIFLLFIKSNQYLYTVGIVEFIQSFIMICSIIMIICRQDKRGLHDFICGTKVVEC